LYQPSLRPHRNDNSGSNAGGWETRQILYQTVRVIMSNNIAIDNILKRFNLSLSNMEAGLVMVEYAAANDTPISKLAQITIQEACEEIQESAQELSNIIGD